MTARIGSWQWLMWKTLWRKNDASIRVSHALAHQEGNKPNLRWPTLFKFLNTVGIFWLCFLLDTACVSKEDFLSNAGMCFGGVAVAIDTVLQSFSGANDRIEIDNFCCLVPCSKRLYKWKSWTLRARSNSSNIVVSIINAQCQLFDSDYRNWKPVEKTRWSRRINQYLYTYASWHHWYSPRKCKLKHLVAISIRLLSMYVHICPVVILIQSHLK